MEIRCAVLWGGEAGAGRTRRRRPPSVAACVEMAAAAEDGKEREKGNQKIPKVCLPWCALCSLARSLV